ncbi:glycosyltransferase family 4 protein [Protaetiibacter larvae]|uniref:Glycosyltransferase family 4 protein n=1 Tax=Protaetiibacter larvae TaxID=2592654 RepID=A0A5C1Y9D3_9MICO|nr:glycosyltransferase family 1 protein [Protaetiibacter larvae]QEO09517.1 glycosyltransferase family 4 protein [Protaetiibacter larvae]
MDKTERTLLFDARSAGSLRMTGWERYTRSLVGLVVESESIVLRATDPTGPGRFVGDLLGIPAASRKLDFVHFLSYPPSPAVPLSKTIYTLYDMTWWSYPETATRLGRNYYRPLAERAMSGRLVLTISETVQSEILARWPGANVRIVNPFVEPQLPAPALPRGAAPTVGHDRPYILAVGSQEPRKNFVRLSEGYLRSGVAGDIDLVVVGRAAWGAAPAGVQYLGRVSDGELARLIAGSLGVFVPSLYEGFGYPVIEALVAGAEVFCSDIPVFREVGAEHVTYFDPTSIESIAAAVRAATSSRKVVSSGFVNPFTRERTRQQLKEIYEEIGVRL